MGKVHGLVNNIGASLFTYFILLVRKSMSPTGRKSRLEISNCNDERRRTK